jgi:hypothetical protein
VEDIKIFGHVLGATDWEWPVVDDDEAVTFVIS